MLSLRTSLSLTVVLIHSAALINESEDSAQEDVTLKPKVSAKKQIEEVLKSVAEQNGDEDMADAAEDDEEGGEDDEDEEKLAALYNPLLSQLMRSKLHR